jgi:hypothetical protein
MKAKTINEVQNFERGLDPKEAMDIGLTYKKHIQDVIAGLKKIGIVAKAHQDEHYAGPVFDFEFENIMDKDDEEDIAGVQLSYVSKKAAEEEGWAEESNWKNYYGFSIADSDGDIIIEPTTNVNQIIKWFAKRLFGLSLKARIIAKQKELDRLNEIKVYLDSLTLSYLR